MCSVDMVSPTPWWFKRVKMSAMVATRRVKCAKVVCAAKITEAVRQGNQQTDQSINQSTAQPINNQSITIAMALLRSTE